MWSGAVAHLHQGLMCSAFKDALLHTLVLRVIICYCRFPLSSKQSGHFLLTLTGTTEACV